MSVSQQQLLCFCALQVTLHPKCLVSISIQANTTTGGDEFAVSGIAVVPFSTAVLISPNDRLNMAVVRAAGAGQLAFVVMLALSEGHVGGQRLVGALHSNRGSTKSRSMIHCAW
jgi:hypothetical protein